MRTTFLTLLIVPTFATTGLAYKEAPLFEHVGPWLPPDIEVVFVSNIPLSGGPFAQNGTATDVYARFAESAMATGNPTDRTVTALSGLHASSGLFAGRRFRFLKTPSGLGLIGSLEGCSFLRSPSDEIAHVLATAAPRPQSIAPGIAVYENGSDRPLALATPEDGLLLVCADRSLAGEILARRGLQRNGNWLKAWEADHVDRGAPIWGWRRFIPGDPSSPLDPAGGLLPNYKDPNARAMGFTMRSSAAAEVTYFTTSNGPGTPYQTTWLMSTSLRVASGLHIITIQFDPSRDSTGSVLGRLALTLLGLIGVV